jgi:hypothetical protein
LVSSVDRETSAVERNFDTECITCMHVMLVVPEHLQMSSVCVVIGHARHTVGHTIVES